MTSITQTTLDGSCAHMFIGECSSLVMGGCSGVCLDCGEHGITGARGSKYLNGMDKQVYLMKQRASKESK